MTSNGGNSPFAWLGLLKWSLAYSDGTAAASSEAKPMSPEDIAFLEKVMSEGIIDEGQRMKCILADLTDTFEMMLDSSSSSSVSGGGGDIGESKQEEKRKELEEEDVIDLLQELRDIVEQIDYARAFMAMGGLPFLLGIATYHADVNTATAGSLKRTIPKSIRKAALGVLSTMCQNNPPVQLSLLEQGHIPQLVRLFFDSEGDDSMREKTVQALSASIREHSMAEHIFCMNEEARTMLKFGLGMQHSAPRPSVQLRKRSLFFLRALLTSDNATIERHTQFQDVISYICTHGINDEWEEDAELREMSLSMLSRLLQINPTSQSDEASIGKPASNIIMQHTNSIGSIGVKRIQSIRSLKDGSEERELASLELEAWETLMVALADAGAEVGKGNSNAPPLAICH
ncbi:hypothetical protein ACHAWU_008598 [Discostella pseudostelligera]|uniref:Nucleotide exchange factor Fes1 domain-containing protein n=1 Tax=Discostella pseudostelligera TaxID=259834 RepID=A0ABD3M8S2_9STRA